MSPHSLQFWSLYSTNVISYVVQLTVSLCSVYLQCGCFVIVIYCGEKQWVGYVCVWFLFVLLKKFWELNTKRLSLCNTVPHFEQRVFLHTLLAVRSTWNVFLLLWRSLNSPNECFVLWGQKHFRINPCICSLTKYSRTLELMSRIGSSLISLTHLFLDRWLFCHIIWKEQS